MSEIKTVLISGGTSGMGRACVFKFLEAGHNVATFARSGDSCKALENELGGKFPQASYLVLQGDVTDEASVAIIVQKTVKKFGAIDILVNNAGRGLFETIDTIKPGDYLNLLNVNLIGVALLSKHAVQSMKKKKTGHIINIASISGKESGPGREFYSASKYGVMGFSEGLRKELNDFEIKVTTICPGMVKTGFFSQHELRRRKTANKGKLPLMLRPEEIASAIYFIASQPGHVAITDITILPFG